MDWMLLFFLHSTASLAAPSAVLRTGVADWGAVASVEDSAALQFTWAVNGVPQDAAQTSYTVKVYRRLDAAVAWTVAASDANQTVAVPPTALNASTAYTWCVSLSLDPTASLLSACLDFQTAPSGDAFPGNAAWIGGGGQVRSTSGLVVKSKPVAARAYVSGVGAFYLFVNGVKIGDHIMDPVQSVYSKTIYYSSFDIRAALVEGHNDVGAVLGNVKWGYTDIWCDMTKAGGPDGCRAFILRIEVTEADGSVVVLDTSDASMWETRTGPIIWDHFFHGETFDATVAWDWDHSSRRTSSPAQTWTTARVMNPPAGTPKQMKAPASALGTLRPMLGPPITIAKILPALSVVATETVDVGGTAWVFDFGYNVQGMVRLELPAGHGLSAGTTIRISIAEIIQGPFDDVGDYCTNSFQPLGCGKNPQAGYCGTAAMVGNGAVCNTYCKKDGNPLRQEPCHPHQSYGDPHLDGPSARYIGDFNDANMTNLYIVRGDGSAETYQPFFATGGFRYAQLSVRAAAAAAAPAWAPTLATLVGLSIHSAVASSGNVTVPAVTSIGGGLVPDVLNRIHAMTRASQLGNLFGIPTDCPQRERRGWMGDAQSSSDEAMLNFDMRGFYSKFLNDMLDDQARWDESSSDKGALADVVPYDGIGGLPGCPVWQVAYTVIGRNLWKHYGEAALPLLRKHYAGMRELSMYFERHAQPTDNLLTTPCYGDWMGWNPESGNRGGSYLTPSGSVTAFYHVLSRGYMSEVAEALGNSAEAQKWGVLHNEGVRAFHARYFNATAGGYSPCVNGNLSGHSCFGTSAHGSQTSNAMALALGAPQSVSGALAASVAKNLAADVEAFGDRFTTGVTGIAWLLPQLDLYGNGERALATVMGDKYPSLGLMAAQNMTTLCENLACSFHNANGGSQNHIMLGGWDAWFSASVGGLDSKVNGSTGGWETVLVRVAPRAITALGEGSAVQSTIRGTVALAWRWDAATKKLTMDLTLPLGSTAEVHTPSVLSSAEAAPMRLRRTRIAGGAWEEMGAAALQKGVLVHGAVVAEVGSGTRRLEALYA